MNLINSITSPFHLFPAAFYGFYVLKTLQNQFKHSLMFSLKNFHGIMLNNNFNNLFMVNWCLSLLGV